MTEILTYSLLTSSILLVHACNALQETEVGGSRAQGQPGAREILPQNEQGLAGGLRDKGAC